jgi:hypothetical protein
VGSGTATGRILFPSLFLQRGFAVDLNAFAGNFVFLLRPCWPDYSMPGNLQQPPELSAMAVEIFSALESSENDLSRGGK